MRLSDEEKAMLAGELGAPRRWAIAHQIAVGEFFDAADFVAVSQAHIMADTESLGEAGVRFLEGLAAAPEPARRVRVPAITDPRGIDFAVYKRLGQSEAMAGLERRTIAALSAFGALMTDTCINYQTIMAPLRGEHVAYGATGSVALFHMPGITAVEAVFAGSPPASAQIGPTEIAAFLARFEAPGDKLDVVVFAAPQLSLYEIAAVADALDGRSINPGTTVIVA